MSLKDTLVLGTYVYVREKNIPHPNLESVIAHNGEASYLYALRILKGRFPKGEPAIAMSPAWAVRYSRFVMRKRFLIAECNIARVPECGYDYFKYVMKGKKLPDEMHKIMILTSFDNPENAHLKKYFAQVDNS